MKLSVSGNTGESAGKIKITLTEDSASHVRYQGTVETSSSGQQRINGLISKKDSLEVSARGGNGVDGKIGADGKKGADGAWGSDATCYLPAERGQDGKRGEDGEKGTNGGPAGNGGEVEICVNDPADLSLFSLVGDTDVRAGMPGRAGRHGRGGKGGKGGKGGRYLDDPGNYHYHRHHHNHPHQDFEPYNPLPFIDSHAPDGKDGPDGYTPTEILYPGAPGIDGSVRYHILSQGIIQSTHTAPYQLKITNPRYWTGQQHGLFEPGDTVQVVYDIHNQSISMSSPVELMPVNVDLSVRSIFQQTGAGQVRGDIPAGGRADNQSAPLTLKIREPLIIKGECSEPYAETTHLRVQLMNTRLARPYAESDISPIRVCYPVQLLPRKKFYTVAIGEPLDLELEVKNISTKALGRKEGRDVFLQIVDEDESNSVVLTGKAVETLGPDQTEKLQARVVLDERFAFGSRREYKANLQLKPIDRNKSMSLIQQQVFTVQVTPRYQHSESGFTLVINAETSPEAVQFWMKQLTSIAQKPVAVWNTSYYGQFPLESEAGSLLADNAHGTLIVLDNEFTGPDSKLIRSSEFIRKDNLLHAAQVYDTSIVIVGDNKKLPESFKTKETGLLWAEPEENYYSLDSLVDALLRETPKTISHARLTLPTETFFSKSSPQQVLDRVAEKLKQCFPHRNYHFSVERVANSSKVVIEIRRLADELNAGVRSIKLSPNEMQDPARAGAVNPQGIINVLSFTQKLDLFMRSTNPYHQQLTQAIISDLLAEQRLVRQTQNYGSWWSVLTGRYRHNFQMELKQLRQLVSTLNTMVQQGSLYNTEVWAPKVIQVLAQMQYHARQQTSFWSRLADFFVTQTNEEINRSTRALCSEALASYGQLTQKSVTELAPTLDNHIARLGFEDKLRQQIGSLQRAIRRGGCFFNETHSRKELFAVQKLLSVCLQESKTSELQEHLVILQKGRFKDCYTEFKKLYPEYQETEVKHHGSYAFV